MAKFSSNYELPEILLWQINAKQQDSKKEIRKPKDNEPISCFGGTSIKLQIVSDLHLEFHADGGKSFLQRLRGKEVDVLLLAGDIHNFRKIREILSIFCDNYREVIYVLGNHELYYSSFESVREILQSASAQISNLHVLDNRVKTIRGKQFLGTTLWFPYQRDNERYESKMNDFGLIEDFRDHVYDENRLAQEFLEEAVTPGSVVITHHLLSSKSILPKYQDDPLNRFFLCPMDQLVKEKRPILLIHGHTHESLDYQLDGTRVLCNPLGYSGYMLNQNFEFAKIVELSS